MAGAPDHRARAVKGEDEVELVGRDADPVTRDLLRRDGRGAGADEQEQRGRR